MLSQHTYYRYNGLTERGPNNDSPSFQCLSLTGLLLPVTLQTREAQTEDQRKTPLAISCLVHERKAEQPHAGALSERAQPCLLSPLRGSMEEHLGVDGFSKKHQNSTSTSPGTFNADYKFWDSAEDLQLSLQNLIFSPLATGYCEVEFESDDENDNCWVQGLVLKPVIVTSPREGALSLYERIGWLNYYKGKEKNKFILAGTETNFLLA